MGQQHIRIPLIGEDAERTVKKAGAETTVNLIPEVRGNTGSNEQYLVPAPGLADAVKPAPINLSYTASSLPYISMEISSFPIKALYNDGSQVVILLGGTQPLDDTPYDKLTLAAPVITSTGQFDTDWDGTASDTSLARKDQSVNVAYQSVTSSPVKITAGASKYAFIDDSGDVYVADRPLTATSGSLTDPSLTALDVEYIDGYFIYITDGTTIKASNLEDPTTIDGTDVLTTTFSQTDMISSHNINGELWVFSSDKMQLFYNAANPIGFPLSPRKNLGFNYGLGARWSAVKIDNGLMWLDNRGFFVYATSVNNAQIKSSPAIVDRVASLTSTTDAEALTYHWNGHIFYQVSFPTDGVTLVYDFLTDQWHERKSVYSSVEGRHLAKFATNYNGNVVVTTYVADSDSYAIDSTINTDDDEVMNRERTTQHITSDGRMIFVDSIVLDVNITNQVTDPASITLEYSKDGGNTWSTAVSRTLPDSNENEKRVVWNRLGRSRSWTFRFKTSSDVGISFIDGFVKARVTDLPEKK